MAQGLGWLSDQKGHVDVSYQNHEEGRESRNTATLSELGWETLRLPLPCKGLENQMGWVSFVFFLSLFFFSVFMESEIEIGLDTKTGGSQDTWSLRVCL